MKFSFFKSKELDFKESNIRNALTALNAVKNILEHCTYDGVDNFKNRIPYLEEIEAAIKSKNAEVLRKLVINAELIGGAGAIWEINIDEENYRKEFDKQFPNFLDSLMQIGIKNGRLKQVRDGFIKINSNTSQQ